MTEIEDELPHLPEKFKQKLDKLIATPSVRYDVNTNDLAKEVQEMPGMFAEVAERLSIVVSQMIVIERAIMKVSADVEGQVRTSAVKKPTEQAIKARVATDPQVFDLGKLLDVYQIAKTILTNRLSALSKRDNALSRLVNLTIKDPALIRAGIDSYE